MGGLSTKSWSQRHCFFIPAPIFDAQRIAYFSGDLCCIMYTHSHNNVNQSS